VNEKEIQSVQSVGGESSGFRKGVRGEQEVPAIIDSRDFHERKESLSLSFVSLPLVASRSDMRDKFLKREGR